uniref:Uncharacterized protein n=1 Tax=Ciona savignyi TaxID=51511 RepID=H2YLN9_CIOSA
MHSKLVSSRHLCMLNFNLCMFKQFLQNLLMFKQFHCCVTLINVVRRLSSLSFEAPTYVQVDRTPPRISSMVEETSPR